MILQDGSGAKHSACRREADKFVRQQARHQLKCRLEADGSELFNTPD